MRLVGLAGEETLLGGGEVRSGGRGLLVGGGVRRVGRHCGGKGEARSKDRERTAGASRGTEG